MKIIFFQIAGVHCYNSDLNTIIFIPVGSQGMNFTQLLSILWQIQPIAKLIFYTSAHIHHVLGVKININQLNYKLLLKIHKIQQAQTSEIKVSNKLLGKGILKYWISSLKIKIWL